MQEAHLALGGSARRSTPNEYVQLKQLVKRRGLLDQQPAYYTWKFLFTLGLLVIGIAFLFIMHNVWDHAIAYCETSMLQSYQDIPRFLHQVSAPLREEKS